MKKLVKAKRLSRNKRIINVMHAYARGLGKRDLKLDGLEGKVLSTCFWKKANFKPGLVDGRYPVVMRLNSQKFQSFAKDHNVVFYRGSCPGGGEGSWTGQVREMKTMSEFLASFPAFAYRRGGCRDGR